MDMFYLNNFTTKMVSYHPTIVLPSINYNLAVAIEEINLDKIDYKLSLDLKCNNIVNGLQNHAAKHPCTFGDCCKEKNGLWKKGNLGL